MAHLLTALALVLQLFCLVHVIKNGKPWMWIFLIFFFPPLGAVAYLIVEVMPGMQTPRFVRSLGHRKKASTGQIRRLREEIEFSDTVTNKVNLGDALLSRNEFAEARQVYSDCLEGAYEDDPVLIHKMAEASFGAKEFEDAILYLGKLEELGYRDYRIDRDYLKALSLAEVGREREAIRILESIAEPYSGEAARYALGSLYLGTEQREKAVQAFRQIIANRKRYKDASIGSQGKWVSKAKKRLKEIEG